MKNRASTVLLVGSAIAATSYYFVVPKPPGYTDAPLIPKVFLFAVGWLTSFVLLSPFWLPGIIPARFTRSARVLGILSGVLLLAVATLLLWQAVATLPWQVEARDGLVRSSIGVAAALVGLWHLSGRSSRRPPASTELQR